jgi:hypothetical protein
VQYGTAHHDDDRCTIKTYGATEVPGTFCKQPFNKVVQIPVIDVVSLSKNLVNEYLQADPFCKHVLDYMADSICAPERPSDACWPIAPSTAGRDNDPSSFAGCKLWKKVLRRSHYRWGVNVVVEIKNAKNSESHGSAANGGYKR